MGKFSPAELPAGQGSTVRPICIGIFTSVAGVLSGYDAGTIGGLLATTYFTDNFSTGDMKNGERVFSVSESSLLVGILSIGTFCGALLAAPCGDYIGRKWGLMTACAIFIVGVVLQVAATAIPLFTAGRAIAGVGVGITSVLAPLYQAETVPSFIRGTINATYQFALTIGIFLAALVEFGTHSYDSTASYRIPVALQALWALILALGLLFLPETPAYLVKINKIEAAKKALISINGISDDSYAAAQIDTIKENQRQQAVAGSGTWKQVFSTRNHQRKRVVTGMALMALQQLTGVNFIFYFGTEFFKSSGVKNPFVIALITTTVNVFATFPGLILVEKWGRRSLLLVGAIGITLSQLIVAIVGTAVHVQDTLDAGNLDAPSNANDGASDIVNKVLITFVCVFIFFFAASWGPVAFVYVSEIFPVRMRAKSMALCVSSNWLLNVIIAFSTPYLTGQGSDSVSLGPKIFFIWAGCNCFSILFVYFFVYETKGLPLDAVEKLYLECPNARQSAEHRRRIMNLLKTAEAEGGFIVMAKEGEEALSVEYCRPSNSNGSHGSNDAAYDAAMRTENEKQAATGILKRWWSGMSVGKTKSRSERSGSRSPTTGGVLSQVPLTPVNPPRNE